MDIVIAGQKDAEPAELTFGVGLDFKSSSLRTRTLLPQSSIRDKLVEQMRELTNLPVRNACSAHSDEGDWPNCNPGYPTSRRAQEYLCKRKILDHRKPPSSRHKTWSGIRISTPIFDSKELDEGLPGVNTMIRALRGMEAEITANVSCGLHIHIGVSDGMTLLLAQKITTLTAVLENSLFRYLVAPSRLGQRNAYFIQQWSHLVRGHVPIDQRNNYVPPLMNDHMPNSSKFGAASWNNYKPDIFFRLFQGIWARTSLQGLSGVLQTEGKPEPTGFSISLRDQEGLAVDCQSGGDLEHGQTTVAFRYMQASFDVDLIQNWIDVLFRIVQIAQLDAAEFKEHLESILELIDGAAKENVPVWQVLLADALKLEHKIPEWREQIERYEKDENISFLDEHEILRHESYFGKQIAYLN